MLPNNEQVKSWVRWLLAGIGFSLGGFGVARGWYSAETLGKFLTSEAVVATLATLIVTVLPGIWGMFVHTEKNAVAVVAAIAKRPDSPVKGVVTEPTQAGIAMANSIPGPIVVPAGTAQATAMAKNQPTRNVA